MSLITPHGGKLVNRVLTGSAADSAKTQAASLPSLTLSPREQFDLEMISQGAFSPLNGFMGAADFDSVCKNMRLANGTVWPIPVVLCPSPDAAAKISPGNKVALKDAQGRLLGILHDDLRQYQPGQIFARSRVLHLQFMSFADHPGNLI